MIRSQLAKNYEQVQANVDELIFDTYKKERPVHKDLFNIKKMDSAIARSEGFSGIGYFEEKQESQVGATDAIYPMFTKTWIPITFSLTVKFSGEAIADDEFGVVERATKGLGGSAVCTQDVYAASVLNTMFSTTGPDGKVLCATDHPILGGSWRNRPTTGMALTRTSLQLALVDWMDEMKNDNGQKIEIDPAYLVTGATLMFTAREILTSVMQPDNANHAQNIIKSDFNIQHVTWKRIIDPKVWALMSKPSDHHVSVYVREGFNTVHWVDDEANTACTRGEYRQIVGYSAAQGIYASPGA